MNKITKSKKITHKSMKQKKIVKVKKLNWKLLEVKEKLEDIILSTANNFLLLKI